MAQAATAVVDDRRAMFSPPTAGVTPVVVAEDGPDVSPVMAMAPQMMAMAPEMMSMAPEMMSMAPMSAPMAAMAPSVQVKPSQFSCTDTS